MLTNLRVLHLKELDLNHEVDTPLHSFRIQVAPFSPMTCARHVYVFTHNPEIGLEGLVDYLHVHSKECELLAGEEAYAFLLRWATGCESWKLKGNDHFVLGDIRKQWTAYCKMKPTEAKPLSALMMMLLTDASQIRGRVETHEEDGVPIREILAKMCNNCASSRALDHTPDYNHLMEQQNQYIEVARKKHLSAWTNSLSKSIAALNSKSEDKTLDIPGKKNTKFISMFEANLKKCISKHNLVQAEQRLDILGAKTKTRRTLDA